MRGLTICMAHTYLGLVCQSLLSSVPEPPHAGGGTEVMVTEHQPLEPVTNIAAAEENVPPASPQREGAASGWRVPMRLPEDAVPFPVVAGPPAAGIDHPLLKLVRRLAMEGVITHQQRSQFEQDPTSWQLLLQILQAWKSADQAGKKLNGGSQWHCVVPDQKMFPGATPSNVKLHNLAVMLEDVLPRQREYLLSGFSQGFDLGVAKNHESMVYKNPKPKSPDAEQALQKGIDEEVALGWSVERSPAQGPVQISNPTYMVPKKKYAIVVIGKYRRVVNLSKHDAFHTSVNSDVSEEQAKLVYVTVEDACDEILRLQAEGAEVVVLSKFDVKSAYRHLPVWPWQAPLIGFADNQGKHYADMRVPMGARLACKIFSTLSGTLSWLLEHVFLSGAGTRPSAPRVRSYIDDFLVIASRADGDAAARVFQLVLDLCGVPLDPAKTETASTRLAFLGIQLDTIARTLSIPEERKAVTLERLSQWLRRKSASVKELESIAGTLCFTAFIIPSGRPFIRRVFALIASARRSNRNAATLGPSIRLDLQWWFSLLAHFDGERPMIASASPPTVPDRVVYSDASNQAAGGHVSGQFTRLSWGGNTTTVEYGRLHVNLKEMFALTVMALTFGPQWRAQVVLFNCDNMVTVETIRRGGSSITGLAHLHRVLAYCATWYGFSFRVVHVPGVLNVVADDASRLVLSEFQSKYPSLVFCPPVLPPKADDQGWESNIIRLLAARHHQSSLSPILPV